MEINFMFLESWAIAKIRVKQKIKKKEKQTTFAIKILKSSTFLSLYTEQIKGQFEFKTSSFLPKCQPKI